MLRRQTIKVNESMASEHKGVICSLRCRRKPVAFAHLWAMITSCYEKVGPLGLEEMSSLSQTAILIGVS